MTDFPCLKTILAITDETLILLYEITIVNTYSKCCLWFANIFFIGEEKAEKIAGNFFNHKINPVKKLRLRIFGNIVNKLLYIAANVIAFVLTDKILNGRFHDYGTNWTKWSRLNNSMAYDYMGKLYDDVLCYIICSQV